MRLIPVITVNYNNYEDISDISHLELSSTLCQLIAYEMSWATFIYAICKNNLPEEILWIIMFSFSFRFLLLKLQLIDSWVNAADRQLKKI